MESDQLYKRKPYKKDSADIKSLLRIKKSLVLTKGICLGKALLTILLQRRSYGN